MIDSCVIRQEAGLSAVREEDTSSSVTREGEPGESVRGRKESVHAGASRQRMNLLHLWLKLASCISMTCTRRSENISNHDVFFFYLGIELEKYFSTSSKKIIKRFVKNNY